MVRYRHNFGNGDVVMANEVPDSDVGQDLEGVDYRVKETGVANEPLDSATAETGVGTGSTVADIAVALKVKQALEAMNKRTVRDDLARASIDAAVALLPLAPPTPDDLPPRAIAAGYVPDVARLAYCIADAMLAEGRRE